MLRVVAIFALSQKAVACVRFYSVYLLRAVEVLCRNAALPGVTRFFRTTAYVRGLHRMRNLTPCPPPAFATLSFGLRDVFDPSAGQKLTQEYGGTIGQRWFANNSTLFFALFVFGVRYFLFFLFFCCCMFSAR